MAGSYKDGAENARANREVGSAFLFDLSRVAHTDSPTVDNLLEQIELRKQYAALVDLEARARQAQAAGRRRG
jgi:hypothetical protein